MTNDTPLSEDKLICTECGSEGNFNLICCDCKCEFPFPEDNHIKKRTIKQALALIIKDLKDRANEEKECMSKDKYAEQEIEHLSFLEGLEFARVRIFKRMGEELLE